MYFVRTLGLLALLVCLPRLGQAQAPISRFVPGEVLIKFRPELSKARRNQVISTRRTRVLRHFGTIDIDRVALPEGADVVAAVKQFLAGGDVLAAQPNYIRHLDAETPPNDPYWLDNSLWGMRKIQAQPAWAQFTTGNGSVVLASIDTGAYYLHPDLEANVWQNPGEIAGNLIDDDGNGYVDDVHGIDVVNHDSVPADDDGHGTHTTGTMAAVGNNDTGVVGVSWNTKVVLCKAFDASGYGEDAGLIECFDYLVALRRRGINLRATNNSYSGKLGPNEPFPSVLKAAFDAAGAAGILNVCSAGNDGSNSDTDPAYPAAFDSASVVSVAASDEFDNRSWFSNFGATSVDLAAPGPSIISTYGNGYAMLSGTSMSAPHVTGAVALLSQLTPGASPATLKSLLLNNVDLLPQWSGLAVSGGRLNVFKAAQAAVAGTQQFQIITSNRTAGGEFTIVWPAVPGIRYQVSASLSLTSAFTALSDVLVAGEEENRLTFTDLAAGGPQKFYRVNTVP